MSPILMLVACVLTVSAQQILTKNGTLIMEMGGATLTLAPSASCGQPQPNLSGLVYQSGLGDTPNEHIHH